MIGSSNNQNHLQRAGAWWKSVW